jgi:signal transduction histidine kinase
MERILVGRSDQAHPGHHADLVPGAALRLSQDYSAQLTVRRPDDPARRRRQEAMKRAGRRLDESAAVERRSLLARIPHGNLTFRLFALVLIAIFPAIFIQGYNEYSLRKAREADIRQQVVQVTRQFGAEIGELREGARQLLLALAELTPVRLQQTEACNALFAALKSRYANYSLLAAADTEGRIFCASAPTAYSSVADQPFFTRAMAQGGLAVGNYWTDTANGQQMIHFALKFDSADGRAAGVVFAGLDLHWLSEHLKERGLSPTSSILIADREGNIIARLPNPEALVGKNMRRSHEAIMDGDATGWEEAVGLDGVTRIFGYVPAALPPRDFFLSAGQSKAEAFAAIDDATKRGVALIIFGLFAATAAAIVGGRKFLREPIRGLLHVATEWRNGNYDARVRVRDPRSEVGHLGAAFNAMADALAARYKAQERAEEDLRHLNATLESRVEVRTIELANANRAKSMFLANMSHELRTPLNAILGFGDMMRCEILGPIGTPAYKEYAQHIHESGQHLLSLVEEMLDLSKIEAGTLQIERVPTKPGTLLAESLVMLGSTAEKAEVEIVVDADTSAWPALDGDPVKLKQVFVNLIGNAIKFTPVGGRVAISADIRDAWLKIRVSDTGIGIRAQDLPLVVQPFYRVNSPYDATHQGAGLGLPFAKAVVELHGGTLGIESQVGSGTTVTVTLPLVSGVVDALSAAA